MRIIYEGVLETRSGGCRPCGTKKASRRVMATRKEYTLLSGATKTFYLKRETEVSDEDGQFLLNAFPDAFKEVK